MLFVSSAKVSLYMILLLFVLLTPLVLLMVSAGTGTVYAVYSLIHAVRVLHKRAPS